MKKFFILTVLLLHLLSVKSQQNEYFFKFIEPDKSTINNIITRTISIARINKDTVFAFANAEEFQNFEKLGYKYTILPKPSILNTKAISMATTVDQMANWDKYPTYTVYRALMKKFEQDYPSLCKLDSIGTSNNGHKIYVVKISKNVSLEEPETEVFYTSTIHGDETAGFVLMLRLIDYLLTNYTTNTQISSMLNSMAIYINPLSNPDGTYYGGDNTVTGAQRYNTLGVDLNRNYPDPRFGNHPDGHVWQTENQAMMSFASTKHFTLSANFHGGVEVVNYPWDSWTSTTKTHPDNNWYIHVSRQFADSAHVNSPTGYFTYRNNGITNGGDWYVISGGRQDYMNLWHHCREVTIELSDDYILPTDQLSNYWIYNKAGLITYLGTALKGFNGVITDNVGNPIKAKVSISGHDTDSSNVYSSSSTGFYARPIEPGTWQVTFSAPGYISQTHSIVVTDWNSITKKNIQLSSEYTVTFDVKNQGTPIANANVNFNGIDRLTNSTGQAVFTNTPQGNGYSYTISLSGYHTATGQVDILQNKTISTDLVPVVTPVYTVTFDVKQLTVPVANATVIFNGIEQQTSSTGQITFTNILQGNSYNYSVSKVGYQTITGQTSVTENKTISINLTSTTYTVTFNVKNQGVAIANANVYFNGSNQLTASDGTVSFSNVLYGRGFSYTVSLNGYHSITGTIDVTENTSISIEFTPVGIITPESNMNILSAWPNPFSDNINISVNLEKPTIINLSIYSLDGRLVTTLANGLYQQGLNTFSGVSLSKIINSGSYIVFLRVGKKSFSQIIQHIR